MARPVFSIVCLLCAVTGTVAETWPLNHRNMQIPINVEKARRGEIKELQLFYSTDEGRNWIQGGVATPDKEAFAFNAPADGTYWFGLIIEKRDGTKEPPSLFNKPPLMRVVVDTTKPVARILSAERQGDEVVVSWQVQEVHPDWGAFKLEYRTPESSSWVWTPVAAKAGPSGQARFRPAQSGPLTVRLQMKDVAGNETTAQKEVAGGPTPANLNTAGVALPAPVDPPMLVPASGTTGSTPPVASSNNGSSGVTVPMPPNTGSVSAPPLPSREPRVPSPSVPAPRDPVVPPDLAGSGLTQTNGRVPQPSTMDRGLLPLPTNPPVGDAGSRVVASTPDGQNPALASPGSSGARTPPAQNPGVVLSNSLQVTLDYEVNKVGPSGVGSVELWLTSDSGATWNRFAEDTDLKPPMVVELPREGIYGMALVVRSRAGLGRRPPQNGERPQMIIEVDTTAPEAQLYAPQPIRGQRDQLQIAWEARDKNLLANPITLEWSERPGGPWQVIGAELPNTGKHNWKLPPNLPYQVYMRLLVRDAAGNVSAAETDKPVLVDLSEPEGVITIIRPAGVGTRQP